MQVNDEVKIKSTGKVGTIAAIIDDNRILVKTVIRQRNGITINLFCEHTIHNLEMIEKEQENHVPEIIQAALVSV